jgi:hypothetical protein
MIDDHHVGEDVWPALAATSTFACCIEGFASSK